MTYISVFLVLCALGIVPLLSYPSNHLRLHHHTSEILPLRSRLYVCRKFNVEQQENMTLSRKFNDKQKNNTYPTRIFISQPTFQDDMEIQVPPIIDWYREDEWKFWTKTNPSLICS